MITLKLPNQLMTLFLSRANAIGPAVITCTELSIDLHISDRGRPQYDPIAPYAVTGGPAGKVTKGSDQTLIGVDSKTMSCVRGSPGVFERLSRPRQRVAIRKVLEPLPCEYYHIAGE